MLPTPSPKEPLPRRAITPQPDSGAEVPAEVTADSLPKEAAEILPEKPAEILPEKPADILAEKPIESPSKKTTEKIAMAMSQAGDDVPEIKDLSDSDYDNK